MSDNSDIYRGLQNFCREALFWQGLEHPNVLPFYGVDLETFLPRLSMVSPWMQHGTIMSHIADKGGPLVVNVDRYVRVSHRIIYNLTETQISY
jgi:hypothetical protein